MLNSRLVPSHKSVSSNLSDSNNSFSVLPRSIMSLKTLFEKLKAFIMSLKSPTDIIWLSEVGLTDNDSPKDYLLMDSLIFFLVKTGLI